MILCCGEALIDFIPIPARDGRTCFLPAPGGCPYNSAVSAGRLGAPVAFLGRISRDFFGDQILDRLAANNVATDRVIRSDQPTTLAFVKRNEKGEAQYAFFANDSADRNLSPADIPDDLTPAACLVFGSISLLMEPGATTIEQLVKREAGKRVLSFDPNIRPGLIHDRIAYLKRFVDLASVSTIVKISDADLEWLYPATDPVDAARALVQAGTTLVIVTMGEHGSRAISRSIDVAVAAVETTVSDTVGAGDSFHAGVLTWLLDHGLLSIEAITALSAADAKSALTFAAHVAAVTCSREGADPAHRHELPESIR